MTTTTEPLDPDLPDMRTARIATAPSLSGLSELEYHLGYLAGSTDRIYIRLWKNSGNGKFNTDWLALADIENALITVPADSSFSADAFIPLFHGCSVNSRYFTIACLLHAGLLCRAGGGYMRHASAELWSQLQAVIDSGTDVQPVSMGRREVIPVLNPVPTQTPKTAKKSISKTGLTKTAASTTDV